MKNTPADLYTESELFHTDGCLKALPFLLLKRDDPDNGDRNVELPTVKAYLSALQESGQSFTPSRLEYHLTELEKKGDRSQALKLNSILIQASGARLSMMELQGSKLWESLHRAKTPEQAPHTGDTEVILSSQTAPGVARPTHPPGEPASSDEAAESDSV